MLSGRSVNELEMELSAVRQHAKTLELDLYGEPFQWPEEVPLELQPDRFMGRAAEVVESCDPSVQVAHVDCTEPPCYLFVRGDRQRVIDLVRNCPAWMEKYGKSSLSTGNAAECSDGYLEEVMVIGSDGDWVPRDHEHGFESRTRKRHKKRLNDAIESWECLDQGD